IAFHFSRAICDSNVAGVDRNRNDAQLAVEVVGHGVSEVTARWSDIDEPGPVCNRRLAFPIKRIEMARETAIGIASGRSQRNESFEVRQNQIEDLSRIDFQHPLLEKITKRIRILVT